jgi:hypothetical protein
MGNDMTPAHRPHQGTVEHLKHHFYVIAPISNPVRYLSRYRLYHEWLERMRAHKAQVLTVELQLGDRSFVVTERGNPMHLQLRGWDEIWHKENMINLAIQRLPEDWQFVAWIDTDIAFTRADWIEETVQQLQHHMWVQLFQTAIDLGPHGETLQAHNGFAWSYLQGKPYGKHYSFWHPGFAWAARREAIDGVGGLIDRGILGAGDHHMALALIGRGASSYPSTIHPAYKAMVNRWQTRALRRSRKDIGFVAGNILHAWHGKKKDRRYVERWDILTKTQYNPDSDIHRNWQGVFQLDEDKTELRDLVRQYFRQRSEDSIDLE